MYFETFLMCDLRMYLGSYATEPVLSHCCTCACQLVCVGTPPAHVSHFCAEYDAGM